MYLFLDTETTGVTPEDRIVSVCWMFYDASAAKVRSVHHLIKPDGFSIPSDATAIHGITTAHAHRVGIPLAHGLALLSADIEAQRPKLYIGHNVNFDRAIVLNEYRRAGLSENLSSLPTFCTMRSTTALCQIPRGNRYKWPKLAELYSHLFAEPLGSAHDAEADVQACARCFFQLRRMGVAVS